MILFILVLVAIVAFWLIATYNYFVTTKTRLDASVQEIGNQLKRQANLIPNLIESTKGYLKHEKDIYEKLTEARKVTLNALAENDTEKMVAASQKLSQALAPLRVVLESNPQLKSAETTVKLMDELRDTADKIMYARRTLIDLTADYNAKVVRFPSNLAAKIFNFKKQPGLKFAATEEALTVKKEETKTPTVKL